MVIIFVFFSGYNNCCAYNILYLRIIHRYQGVAAYLAPEVIFIADDGGSSFEIKCPEMVNAGIAGMQFFTWHTLYRSLLLSLSQSNYVFGKKKKLDGLESIHSTRVPSFMLPGLS